MTSKSDKIAALKLEYPSLKVGSDESGYTDLTTAEYETTIEAWAISILDNEAREQAALDAIAAKETAIAKLASLGLDLNDLKSLGF